MTEPHPHMSAGSAELLPCPFCGGKPTRYAKNPDARVGQVICENDECFGPRTPICNQADADAMWNLRITDPAQGSLLSVIEAEARRIAGMYPVASDGHNTFRIFADWVASLAAQPPAAPVETDNRLVMKAFDKLQQDARSSAGNDDERRKERVSMAREICMHRGENPDRTDLGGNADWEKYEPLAGAVIREAERLFKLRTVPQTAWAPIETAPKDGTDIIVYRPKFDGDYIPRVGTDYWMLKLLEPTWAKSRKDCPPTHWMPFPEPPPSSLSRPHGGR